MKEIIINEGNLNEKGKNKSIVIFNYYSTLLDNARKNNDTSEINRLKLELFTLGRFLLKNNQITIEDFFKQTSFSEKDVDELLKKIEC